MDETANFPLQILEFFIALKYALKHSLTFLFYFFKLADSPNQCIEDFDLVFFHYC